VRRKPAQMLEFIGVRQGIVALDLSAGGGYTTELLARAVHPGGRVYAQVPRAPSQNLTARLAKPTLIGVSVVAQPFESPVPAEVAKGGVDLVTMMFNYHDLGHLGVDRERMNRAVFEALRPGGLYVIADHSGRPGTGISEAGTLHRVEEAFVREEGRARGLSPRRRGRLPAQPGRSARPRDARAGAAQGRVRPEVREALNASSPSGAGEGHPAARRISARSGPSPP
jgi:predicted methyltransferase